MIINLLLGITQFILIIFIIIFEYKRKSTSVFLWGMLFIVFGMMHMITCLVGSNYSSSVLNEASLYTILFCLVYLITRIFITRNNSEVISIKEINKYSYNDNSIKIYNKKLYYILISLLIIVLLIRFFTLITNSGGILNTSWSSMRSISSSNDIISFSQIFTVLFFVGSSSLIIAILNKRKKDIFLISLLIILEVLLSRNRIEILPLLCAIMLDFIIKNKKITIKSIGIAIISLVAIIYIVYGLRVFRHYGTLGKFFKEFNVIEFNDKINMYMKTDNGELGLKNFFYYFISNDNRFLNFNKGHTYIRMLMFLIPTRLSFGLKPTDFAISMGNAVNPLIKGYSVHPTLFGDCYANFGFLGFIFMGTFWAIYVKLFDEIVLKTKSKYLKVCFSLIMGIAYIIIGRGSVYNGFIWQFYSIVFLYIINIICKIKIKEGNEV